MMEVTECRTLTYEDADLMETLIRAAASVCKEGEFIIHRRPFRWHKLDDGVLPNCYEMFDVDEVCEQSGLDPVHYFNHFAIVRRKA